MICKHIFYSGQVQGVGFRYTANRMAQDYAICGFVKNMIDGRVEVVAEGPPEQIEAFMQNLAGAMKGYIRSTEVHEEPYLGEFNSFGVRF